MHDEATSRGLSDVLLVQDLRDPSTPHTGAAEAAGGARHDMP
ncbi:alpha/beta hydrolase [Nonomuraea basaltis]